MSEHGRRMTERRNLHVLRVLHGGQYETGHANRELGRMHARATTRARLAAIIRYVILWRLPGGIVQVCNVICVRLGRRHAGLRATRAGHVVLGIGRRCFYSGRRVHRRMGTHARECDAIEGNRQTQQNTQQERPDRHAHTVPLSGAIVVQKL